MKVVHIEQPKEFVPIKLEITIKSKDELTSLIKTIERGNVHERVNTMDLYCMLCHINRK